MSPAGDDDQCFRECKGSVRDSRTAESPPLPEWESYRSPEGICLMRNEKADWSLQRQALNQSYVPRDGFVSFCKPLSVLTPIVRSINTSYPGPQVATTEFAEIQGRDEYIDARDGQIIPDNVRLSAVIHRPFVPAGDRAVGVARAATLPGPSTTICATGSYTDAHNDHMNYKFPHSPHYLFLPRLFSTRGEGSDYLAARRLVPGFLSAAALRVNPLDHAIEPKLGPHGPWATEASHRVLVPLVLLVRLRKSTTGVWRGHKYNGVYANDTRHLPPGIREFGVDVSATANCQTLALLLAHLWARGSQALMDERQHATISDRRSHKSATAAQASPISTWGGVREKGEDGKKEADFSFAAVKGASPTLDIPPVPPFCGMTWNVIDAELQSDGRGRGKLMSVQSVRH
ncbi:hypothetical protein EDB86DRAFT_3216664 [Lactarius hatsudake]|nr:hypothetical protein EDB86DRAFT_3216664 [Lactarius hatsudake]